ncbi:MAG: hypothetical protein FRX49_04143 [Trebouxia sp. A1-2]|nr:MAG: hypothetical protein FRX49_04143 [Trebouxia sp. A1-2]
MMGIPLGAWVIASTLSTIEVIVGIPVCISQALFTATLQLTAVWENKVLNKDVIFNHIYSNPAGQQIGSTQAKGSTQRNVANFGLVYKNRFNVQIMTQILQTDCKLWQEKYSFPLLHFGAVYITALDGRQRLIDNNANTATNAAAAADGETADSGLD